MSKPRKTLAELAAEAEGGPVCPNCGCRQLERYKTEAGQQHDYRYRRCRNCGTKVYTRQQKAPPEEIIRVVKECEDSQAGKPQLTLVRECA
jgi:hypothetical protein